MTDGHCFISYSNADGLDFATKLSIELENGQSFIKVWFDKKNMFSSGGDWDEQIASAISNCKCLLFVVTKDSIAERSTCQEEWTWALKYKKPVIPLIFESNVELPFQLANRLHIDFSSSFATGIDTLRNQIAQIESPEGQLYELQQRLTDANRDLRRANDNDQRRIKAEIDELTEQIKRQEEIVRNPKGAEDKTEKNIQSGLERERQPEKSVVGKTSTKFINPPPGIAPNYFQNRFFETKQITDFLNNGSQRLMTVVGRAGVGKTALVCRLLNALERGELPDDLGEMKVDGIVYLSETGSHRVNFANVFADLSKLLPASQETAKRLEGIYKNPQTSTGDKMRALLDAFPSGRVILLLDNFETLIDPESLSLRDSELSEALNDMLSGQRHAVKAVITTRIAPRDLAMVEPGRQHHLSLDEGLESPYAENVLREMDADGRVGLKTAPDALLNKAREKTRGYPRALEALYAILSVDRYTTLKELLEVSLPNEVVQKLVGEAFNRLDPSAQKVMQALAVYNRPVSPAAIDYLLQPHLPSVDSAPVLNRLVNMHFARKEAGRYYLHPVDKEYAFSLIENNEPSKPPTTNLQSLVSNHLSFTQHDLLNRAADYFAQARKPRAEWKKLDDLAAQLAEFDLRCKAGDYDTAASVLTEIDFEYLLLWGHYRLMIDMHEILQGKITDSPLARISAGNLGSAFYSMGQVNKAIQYYEFALNSARENKNRQAEGAWLSNLGNVYYSLGDAHKAIESYEQSLIIAREVGDKKGERVPLDNLGSAYADLGVLRKAIDFHEQALIIAREIGDHRGEGISFGNLGNRYAELGNARKAIEYYEQALVTAREISDRRNEGIWLSNLGSAYADLDDAAKAIEYYEQALVIAHEIGDRRNEGVWLSNLGSAYADLDNTFKAIEYYEQALVIAREIGDPLNESATLSNLGNIERKSGRYEKAVDLYQNALNISHEIGDLSREGLLLGHLGLTYSTKGEIQQAIIYYERSLALALNIGDTQREILQLSNLGNTQAILGHYGESKKFFESALEICIRNSDKYSEYTILNALGTVHALMNEYKEALQSLEKALSIAQLISDPENIAITTKQILNIQEILEHPQKANQLQLTVKDVGKLAGTRIALLATNIVTTGKQ